MGQPAARIGDLHTCPVHGGGPVLSGNATVLIGGMPAATLGDKAACVPSPPDAIIDGEPSVLIGNKPAARMGDKTTHGGLIALGCPTVWIGDNAGRCLAEAAKSGASFVYAMEE